MAVMFDDREFTELRNLVFVAVVDAMDDLRAAVALAGPKQYPATEVETLRSYLTVLTHLFNLTETGQGGERDEIDLLFGTAQQLYNLAESTSLLLMVSSSSQQDNEGIRRKQHRHYEEGEVTDNNTNGKGAIAVENGNEDVHHDDESFILVPPALIQLQLIDALAHWVSFLTRVYPEHPARHDVECTALLAMTEPLMMNTVTHLNEPEAQNQTRTETSSSSSSSSSTFIFLSHCLRLLTSILVSSSLKENHSVYDGADIKEQIELSAVEASLCHLTYLDSVLVNFPLHLSGLQKAADINKYLRAVGARVAQMANSAAMREVASIESKDHPIVESPASRIICMLTSCAAEWQSSILTVSRNELITREKVQTDGGKAMYLGRREGNWEFNKKNRLINVVFKKVASVPIFTVLTGVAMPILRFLSFFFLFPLTQS